MERGLRVQAGSGGEASRKSFTPPFNHTLTTDLMRILSFSLFCLLLSAPAFAQIDAKLNLGSAIFGGLNVSADIALSENTSIAPGFGIATTKVTVDGDRYNYKVVRFVPEFRYYFSPDYGADRFFVGAYGKLAALSAGEADGRRIDGTKGTLGLLVGNKWIAQSGFVFELNFGLGTGGVFPGADGDAPFIAAIDALSKVDVRLGIVAGWRF